MSSKTTTYCSDIAYDFSDFYQNENYTDCTIYIPNQPPIHAHRVVLSSWSTFFESSFTSGMDEDIKREVIIEFNPCNMLPEMIQYMYTEYINLTQENIMPLLELSKHYGVDSLYEGLCSKLDEVVTPDNVLYFVQVCYENNLHHSLDVISNHVARLYDSLDRTEFTNIFDISIFCKILTRAVNYYGFNGDLREEVFQFMGNEAPETQEQADMLNSLSELSDNVPKDWKVK